MKNAMQLKSVVKNIAKEKMFIQICLQMLWAVIFSC